jgi:hypothetical protein
MIRAGWKVLIACGLAGASLALYGAFYLLHPDRAVVADWFLGSLAFLPMQLLIVTVIVDGLLGQRERHARLKKLNMVIGVFFSEVGNPLLSACLRLDRRADEIRGVLAPAATFPPAQLGATAARMRGWRTTIEARPDEIEALRAFLVSRREILTALMANPAVLEHEGFSDLLIATFHVAEELAARPDLGALPADDAAHLALDVERVYPMLVAEWLSYLRHLQEDYPHLFSLAARTNPFDPQARVHVQRSADGP